MCGENAKNQVLMARIIPTSVVLLLVFAVTQLLSNLPIGIVVSLFTDSEEHSRYLSARIFFVVCLIIYLCCSVFLIVHSSVATMSNKPSLSK